MSIEDINTAHKAMYADLLEEYGTREAIPHEQWFFCNEVTRARFALEIWPGEVPAKVLMNYGVMGSVIELLLGEIPELERAPKRADKWAKVITWCAENVDAEVTPDEVAEAGGFSYATAIKFIKDRPDLFRKVRRGVYGVRDPKRDRIEEEI